MECRVFIFPTKSFKMFDHFAPTDAAGRTSTLYVDLTAIPNYPCPEREIQYWGNGIITNDDFIDNVESWKVCGTVEQK